MRRNILLARFRENRAEADSDGNGLRFHLVFFDTPRGGSSTNNETRGISEGPVITELPDDYEVENGDLKAIQEKNHPKDENQDSVDSHTKNAANTTPSNDTSDLNLNVTLKPVERKQVGSKTGDMDHVESTNKDKEKTKEDFKPKRGEQTVHLNLEFEVTDSAGIVESKASGCKHAKLIDKTNLDTKELEIDSPTVGGGDYKPTTIPFLSANMNDSQLTRVSDNNPTDMLKPTTEHGATAAPTQNARNETEITSPQNSVFRVPKSRNAAMKSDDHKHRSEHAQAEPSVHSDACKPQTHNGAHHVDTGKSQYSQTGQDVNEDHVIQCHTCYKQKYCQHKEIKEFHKHCAHGGCTIGNRCTNCSKIFSEEELLALKERRSAKLNKNAAPRKSKRAWTETKEIAEQTYSKEKSSSTNTAGQCSFDDLVASVGLTVRNVSADGNCMFTAVVDQLRIHGNFTYTPRTLRSAVVGYLRYNPHLDQDTHLQEFVEEPWEEYLEHMSRDGYWGDHVVIRGLANLLKTNIRIYREQYDGLDITDTAPTNADENDHNEDDINSSTIDNASPNNEQKETIGTNRVIFLGHLYGAHYVSLRPLTWKENLLQVLEKKQQWCISTKYPIGIPKAFPEVPNEHMSFAMKYCLRQQLIFLSPLDGAKLQTTKGRTFHGDTVHNKHKDSLFVLRVETLNSADTLNTTMFISPIDAYVTHASTSITSEYRYYIEPVLNANTTIRLVPRDQSVWKRCLNDQNHLRIISPLDPTPSYMTQFSSCIAFFCEMPEKMSQDWLNRSRPQGWPENGVVQAIVHKGVRVIPAPSVSPYDWKYDFRCAENMIVETAMNKEQKECFKIAQLILNEAMVDESLAYVALKHAFFFHCEQTAEDEWKYNPAACVLAFLDRLLSLNSSGKAFFPNYFEGAVGTTDYGIKIEDQMALQNRLLVARRHPFECLYFAASSLNPSWSIGQMFNSVIENIMTGGPNAYSQCFLPTTRDAIADLVIVGEYGQAFDRCCEAAEDLNNICRSGLTLSELLQHVIHYVIVPIQQWVFALQADFNTKLHFLDMVNVDQDVVPITNIYGTMFDDILRSDTGQQVMIPRLIIEPKNFFLTTRGLLKFMKQQQFDNTVICSAVETGIMYICPRLREVSYGTADTTAALEAKEAVMGDFELLMKDVKDVITEQQTRRTNDRFMSILQTIMSASTQSKRLRSDQSRQRRKENVESFMNTFFSMMSSISQEGADFPM